MQISEQSRAVISASLERAKEACRVLQKLNLPVPSADYLAFEIDDLEDTQEWLWELLALSQAATDAEFDHLRGGDRHKASKAREALFWVQSFILTLDALPGETLTHDRICELVQLGAQIGHLAGPEDVLSRAKEGRGRKPGRRIPKPMAPILSEVEQREEMGENRTAIVRDIALRRGGDEAAEQAVWRLLKTAELLRENKNN